MAAIPGSVNWRGDHKNHPMRRISREPTGVPRRFRLF